ncbi:MAG: glycosyltransferase [Myxococcota bacterium]
MAESPILSIVMSVRNAASTVEETMRSILAEREIDFELVLMDNGCTDDTIPRVRAFRDSRIRIYPGPGTSLAAAINEAFGHARGRYIVRIDGDDLCPLGSLARRVEWLEAHPEFGAVSGAFETMDVNGRNRARTHTGDEPLESTQELLDGKPRTHIGTFVIRADAVRAIGGTREWFKFLDDQDFQFRLAEHCRIMYLPILSLSYRLHNATITHSMGSETRKFYDRTANEFRRQRRETGEDDLMRGQPPQPPVVDREKPFDPRVQLSGHLVSCAWREHAKGRRRTALEFGLRALRQSPLEPALWKNMMMLAVKPPRVR